MPFEWGVTDVRRARPAHGLGAQGRLPLRLSHAGQTVTLSGWVHSRRDLGGVIFIDIRDREGRTQTVFDPSDLPKDLFDRAAALRSECVISVTGKVRKRPEDTNNSKIATGEIEVGVTALEVLNMADVLPFPVDDPEVASKVNEELRLKYRYLDLRRPEMARNMKLRSKVATIFQQFNLGWIIPKCICKSTPQRRDWMCYGSRHRNISPNGSHNTHNTPQRKPWPDRTECDIEEKEYR